MLAHEVEAVFPELVTTWGEDGYKAVAYDKLTGVLLAAVQEVQAITAVQHQQFGTLVQQLTIQAQQLAALQAQNTRLQTAVGQFQEREAAHQAQSAALAARLERLETAAAQAARQASR